MSLKLLQPGVQPLGQFDGYDTDYLTLKGGEVCTFGAVLVTSGDKAAADSADGYVNPSTPKRPVVTHTFSGAGTLSGVSTSSRPLMLADDGITGYGTLFGSVVGGVVGQLTTGQTLGPHTATGSGKVTCWDKPGLYAVSLDACDTAASDGLQPTNTSITTGQALTFTPGGLLTPVGSTAAAGNTVVVGRLVDFESNGSLVNTPNRLVAALNSPSGNVSSVGPRQFAFATFWFSSPLT